MKAYIKKNITKQNNNFRNYLKKLLVWLRSPSHYQVLVIHISFTHTKNFPLHLEMLANLKNSMFSFFSKKKNSKTLEEVKFEKSPDNSENEIVNFPKDCLVYDYIKKCEIEKQILLKRRRDPNVSAEYIENSYKKRLTGK